MIKKHKILYFRFFNDCEILLIFFKLFYVLNFNNEAVTISICVNPYIRYKVDLREILKKMFQSYVLWF